MNNNTQITSQNISRMGTDSMVEHQLRVMKKKKQRKVLRIVLLLMWLAVATGVIVLVLTIANNKSLVKRINHIEDEVVKMKTLYNVEGQTMSVPLDEVEWYLESGEWSETKYTFVTLYHPDESIMPITVTEQEAQEKMKQDSHWRESDGFVYLVNDKEHKYHIVERKNAEKYTEMVDYCRIVGTVRQLGNYSYDEAIS